MIRVMLCVVSAAGSLLLAAAPYPAQAEMASGGRVLYVSPDGSNRDAGTSQGQAFRTIQHCADVAQPGDTCLVLDGTYRETVRPARSGAAGRPITFAAAPGAHPVIDGADPVGGWTRVQPSMLGAIEAASGEPYLATSGFAAAVNAGDIYRAHVAVNPALQGEQLLDHGQMMIQARWPNTGLDLEKPTLEYAADGTSGTTIVDPALTQPAGYWDGVQMQLTTWFTTETETVSDYQPGQLTVPPTTTLTQCTPPHAGGWSKFYLFGRLGLLDSAHEWFYEPRTQTLYYYPAGGAQPQTDQVQFKQRTYAFDLSELSYITVRGLDLFDATITTDGASDYDVIDAIHARYLSQFQTVTEPPASSLPESDVCDVTTDHENDTGIVLAGHNDLIQNSVLDWSAGNGVSVQGTGNTVTGNLIRNTDYGNTYAAGVEVTGGHQLIEHNTIWRAGRNGINVDFHYNGYQLHNDRIAYNDVSLYTMLQSDDGAIEACCVVDMTGTRIDHNWLHNYGAVNQPFYSAAGIMFDSGTGGAVIDHNVAWNNLDGARIQFQHPGDTKPSYLYNNTFTANDQYGISFQNYQDLTGMTVINNILEQPIDGLTAPGLTASHNLLPGTDPLFADPADHNYQLASASPAIDAGTVIQGITGRYAGAAPDIGAYEYGLKPWKAGCNLAECPKYE